MPPSEQEELNQATCVSNSNLAMWHLMAAPWKHTWISGVLPVANEVGLEPTHAMSMTMQDLECTIRREKSRLTEISDPKVGKQSEYFLVLEILLFLPFSQGQGHGFIGWRSLICWYQNIFSI